MTTISVPDTVSGNDQESIQETLYLVSIPGMRESILEGLATPL